MGAQFSTWTRAGAHHDTVVKVSVQAAGGQGLDASGTGVLIRVNHDKPAGRGFEGYCLTAQYVVATDHGGRKIKVI